MASIVRAWPVRCSSRRNDLLAFGKAESADLAQRAVAVAVRHAMAALFAALVGGAPPLPPHSASARALRTLQPAL